jgi:hypothetical protein
MRALDLWAQSFLSDTPDTATCQLPVGAWRMVQDDFPDVTRLIGKLTVGSRTVYCALGSPIQPIEFSVDNLYVPLWVLQGLGIDGVGERAKIEWLSQEAFPEATRIVLKPCDSAFYGTNVKEVLEVALTRFGVLQTGDLIPVTIESLGGMEIWFDVVKTEPANVVLLQGEEVEIEFAPDPVAASAAVAASVPVQRQEEPFDSTAPMAPLAPEPVAQPLFPGTGRTLGGGVRQNPWKVAPAAAPPKEAAQSFPR